MIFDNGSRVRPCFTDDKGVTIYRFDKGFKFFQPRERFRLTADVTVLGFKNMLDGVHPEPVRAAPQPKPCHLFHLRHDFGILIVQIGHLAPEQS